MPLSAVASALVQRAKCTHDPLVIFRYYVMSVPAGGCRPRIYKDDWLQRGLPFYESEPRAKCFVIDFISEPREMEIFGIVPDNAQTLQVVETSSSMGRPPLSYSVEVSHVVDSAAKMTKYGSAWRTHRQFLGRRVVSSGCGSYICLYRTQCYYLLDLTFFRVSSCRLVDT